MRPVGQDTGFQQFSTPMEGIDAMRQDLAVKIGGQSQAMQARFGQGYTPTLQNLIATWAPPEENNTAQYVMFVSQKTGIGPNQPLTQQDIDRLIPAMIEMEGGQQAVDYYQQPQNVTQQVTGGQAPQNNFSRSPFVNNLSGGGAGQNQQIFEQVREAISRGASPDAVYNRLRGMGIDPTPFMAR